MVTINVSCFDHQYYYTDMTGAGLDLIPVITGTVAAAVILILVIAIVPLLCGLYCLCTSYRNK